MGALGDAATTSAYVATAASTGATIVASTGGTATLIALGVSSQAVPVVGTILGAVAITAGLIARAQGKAKAIRGSGKEVDAQNTDLRVQSADLDNQINDITALKNQIVSQIKGLGVNANVSGLGSLTSFFKDVFTPGKVAQSNLNKSNEENTRLIAEVNAKISTLQTLLDQFEALKAQFIKISTQQKILIGGGVTILVFGIGYLIFSTSKK